MVCGLEIFLNTVQKLMSAELQKTYESPFIKKMIKILENNQYYHIIRWDQTRTMIDIVSVQKMEELVLPLYFRHNRFPSFIRQLNLYGFKKMRKTGMQRFSHRQLMNGEGLLSIGSRRKNQRERIESGIKEQQQYLSQMVPKQEEISEPQKKDKQSEAIPTSKTIPSAHKQTKQIKQTKQTKQPKNKKEQKQQQPIPQNSFPFFMPSPFPPAMNGSMMPGHPMMLNHSIPQPPCFPSPMQMMSPYSFPGYYPYGFPPMGYPPGPMIGFPHSFPFLPQSIQGNQINQNSQLNMDNMKQISNQSIPNATTYGIQNNSQSIADKRQKK